MLANLAITTVFFLGSVTGQTKAPITTPPNIIVILADDIGYGDLGCYGATRVKTPNLDRLAATGLRFTDGHSASSTCTPTRYALLTGEYPWRKKGTGILPGDAPLIIEPGRPTLPRLLQQAGYSTACVGKWHLGLGDGSINWNKGIAPGPREIGFDYSFIIPATGDRTPCVYVENGKVAGLDPNDPIEVNYKQKVGNDPTGNENPELLKMKLSLGHDKTIVNGISRIGWMSGGKSARWVDEDMADTITQKAIAFIQGKKEKPFFLYFATHDIHVPRVPHKRFVGTSQCGTRGDAIHQLDWSVGEVMKALSEQGLANNTLVVFSSDNGPVLDDGYADGAVRDLNGHKPAGPLRGTKYSLYEGGHRVPFIANWPGMIGPGVSKALICQVDLLASLNALTGKDLPPGAGPDSFQLLNTIIGKEHKGREHLVSHTRETAIRLGDWKFIPGTSLQGPKKAQAAKGKDASRDELYNLGDDIAESKNILNQNSDKAREMKVLLEKLHANPVSRPGQ